MVSSQYGCNIPCVRWETLMFWLTVAWAVFINALIIIRIRIGAEIPISGSNGRSDLCIGGMYEKSRSKIAVSDPKHTRCLSFERDRPLRFCDPLSCLFYPGASWLDKPRLPFQRIAVHLRFAGSRPRFCRAASH